MPRGGKRPGAGRPKGAKNRRKLIGRAIVATVPTGSIEETGSLPLLQAVYRDPKQPLGIRLSAATVAIAYEYPRMAAVGVKAQRQADAEALADSDPFAALLRS